MARLILDIRKSVEGNAAAYFEKAKKARKKLEGAKSALVKTQQRLQQLVSQRDEAASSFAAENEERQKAAERHSSSEWYQKFRWFISSEGFLCVGGRDATTNEMIIKKHTGKDDVVFHAELAGSPFFVVQRSSTGKPIGSSTIEEAAVATASYSRAWKAGLQSVDVYWVNPGQVSKEARAGEYLAKGAFMIYGKKNPVRAAVGLAIGITGDGKIMGGPTSAVAAGCSKYVKIVQGNDKPSDAAKKIAKLLGLSTSYLDELIRVMPAGECKILRS